MAVLSIIIFALVTLWCWRLYSNHKQLDHVPGPLLAGFSDFWRAWLQRKGELRGKLVELHQQYGPVVRYGVRSVSINDPRAVDIVYGSRAGFVIADAYKVIVGISQGKEVDSVVTIRDETRHNRLRRSVANAFTATAALDYEPHIDRTMNELLKNLNKKQTVDLSRQMLYFGLDAASGFAFNSPMGNLAADADVHGMIAVTRERMRYWTAWGSLPGLERLLYRNPIAIRMKGASQSGVVRVAVSRLQERKKAPQKGSETPDLLTRFLEALNQDPDTLNDGSVISLLMSMIGAGSDTVAITSTAIMFYLMKNDSVLSKLQSELEARDLSRPIPAYSQISKLPYLHAVIKEGMRLFPALTHPLERLVPSGGVNIASTFLPQGTSVGCLQLAMHLNSKVFGDDAGVFRPERWLEADAEQSRIMEMAHLGFGRGRRVCIGQNIATMELKKVVSAMVMNYKWTLKDPTAQLDADVDLAVACPKAMLVGIEPRI